MSNVPAAAAKINTTDKPRTTLFAGAYGTIISGSAKIAVKNGASGFPGATKTEMKGGSVDASGTDQNSCPSEIFTVARETTLAAGQVNISDGASGFTGALRTTVTANAKVLADGQPISSRHLEDLTSKESVPILSGMGTTRTLG